METSTHLHLRPTPRAPVGKGWGWLKTLSHPSLLLPGEWEVFRELLAQSTATLAFACVRKSSPRVASGAKEGPEAPQSLLPAACPLGAGPGEGLLQTPNRWLVLAALHLHSCPLPLFPCPQLEPGFLPWTGLLAPFVHFPRSVVALRLC